MTHGSRMLVLASPADDSRARAIADAIAGAWPTADRPWFEVRCVDAIEPSRAVTFSAIIVLPFGGESPSGGLAVLDAIEEAEVPILALVDPAASGAPWAGSALTAPIDAPPAILAARLEGMLHGNTAVKRLRTELAIAQRFQGGLRGEITRIHDELQLAARVQQEFLPRELPSLHGLSFGALWRPANYVSGDIYDVARLDEDHIGVFIADAVGHGVPAALMTMVIARALPVKEVGNGSYRIVPPGEALARLNTEMIRHQGQTTRFATAIYAVIDCRARTVRMAGAGHPPAILFRRDEPPRELTTEGGLLGVFGDETFEEIAFDLHVDDRVLFYSDGFEVAFPTDAAESHDRKMPSTKYREEFALLRNLPSAPDMVDTIAARLDAQPGSLHQVDDLTLVCLHAEPIAASAASGIATHTAGASRGPTSVAAAAT